MRFWCVSVFLFLLVSCGTLPIKYTTMHGLNVYCQEGVCFPKDSVEVATDVVIDQLSLESPLWFNRVDILNALNSQWGRNDIFFKRVRVGEAGSCATPDNPDGRCGGFRCTASWTGWCRGLHKITTYGDGSSSSTLSVVKFDDCLSKNALEHELVHFFQHLMWNISDPKHLTSGYWPGFCYNEFFVDLEDRLQCVNNSLVKKAQKETCKILCSEMCEDG